MCGNTLIILIHATHALTTQKLLGSVNWEFAEAIYRRSLCALLSTAHKARWARWSSAIEAATDLTLVAALGKQDNLTETIQQTNANIVVDLTVAGAAFENTQRIIAANAHPVIGTSGLLPNEIIELQAVTFGSEFSGIIVPNFSLGAVLMMRYAADAARYLDHAEIIELHHDQKMPRQALRAVRQNLCKLHATQRTVPIHSVRLPGLVAHQEVIFGDLGETLTLRHDSNNRACFRPGLLLACRKVTSFKTWWWGWGNCWYSFFWYVF